MTSDLINYVGRYGGFCRDCADNLGTCPLSGMPCDPKQQTAVIKHTIEALKYGIEHGFIKSPFAVKVPDVPELVRYGPKLHNNFFHHMEKSPNGAYVRHDQAAAVIARLEGRLDNLLKYEDSNLKRAEAAEAKLTQSEKQEPVAWRKALSDIDGHVTYSNKNLEGDWQPLYTAPVASDADLRAENEVSVPILKGVAFKSGDGWKSTTKEGDVCFVWNKELPKPYAQGQYNRVGAEHLAVGTDEFKFEPASLDEVVTLFSSLNRAALNPSEPRT